MPLIFMSPLDNTWVYILRLLRMGVGDQKEQPGDEPAWPPDRIRGLEIEFNPVANEWMFQLFMPT